MIRWENWLLFFRFLLNIGGLPIIFCSQLIIAQEQNIIEPVSNSPSIELFEDLNFERGFEITANGKRLGLLSMSFEEGSDINLGAPVWRLATHTSRFNLAEGLIKREENLVSASTPGQRAALRRSKDGEITLTLEVTTDYEYVAPRQENEQWVHLLLERDWTLCDQVLLNNLSSLVFSCDLQVEKSERLMSEEEYNPNLHTTQLSVYFIIANIDPTSSDYNDYIWFGISVFDDRWEVQPNYIMVDGDPKTIGTGKLIYRLGEQKTIDDLMEGNNPYFKRPVHLCIDLMKYVDDMLSAAHQRGFLLNTASKDLALRHFNFGWETPGIYHSSFSVKNLHLIAARNE